MTAFDVELLTIARLHGYRICPVPVVWSYGEGSKVRPARDTWHNVRDVLRGLDRRETRRYRMKSGVVSRSDGVGSRES